MSIKVTVHCKMEVLEDKNMNRVNKELVARDLYSLTSPKKLFV